MLHRLCHLTVHAPEVNDCSPRSMNVCLRHDTCSLRMSRHRLLGTTRELPAVVNTSQLKSAWLGSGTATERGATTSPFELAFDESFGKLRLFSTAHVDVAAVASRIISQLVNSASRWGR